MSDPTWLPEVLTKAGLKVSVLDGALGRGHGDMWDIEGLMDHHTGASGNSSPWSIANHPQLGLCSQLFLPRNGKPVVCGVGISWHGGDGGGYSWIRDVNAQLIGMEMDNNGTEGWGPDQYWSCVRVNAAVFNHIKKPKDRSIGHKEWAGKAQGKWDPGGMNMLKLRDDIGRMMLELLGTKPAPIANEINRIAGFSPWLGKRLMAAEQPTRKVAGRYVRFEHGNVYWSTATGAIAVPTAVLQVYDRLGFETGFLGLPKRFHIVVKDRATKLDVGDVQGFQGGTVMRKYGTTGFVLHGQIGERYAREQWQNGALGWPTSDEYTDGSVIIQDFEGGQLLCDRNGTVKVDRGDTLWVPPGR